MLPHSLPSALGFGKVKTHPVQTRRRIPVHLHVGAVAKLVLVWMVRQRCRFMQIRLNAGGRAELRSHRPACVLLAGCACELVGDSDTRSTAGLAFHGTSTAAASRNLWRSVCRFGVVSRSGASWKHRHSSTAWGSKQDTPNPLCRAPRQGARTGRIVPITNGDSPLASVGGASRKLRVAAGAGSCKEEERAPAHPVALQVQAHMWLSVCSVAGRVSRCSLSS
jgi:hypothetical protein